MISHCEAQSSASLSFMGPGGVTGAAQTMSAANFYPASPDAMMQSAMLHSIPIYNIQGKYSIFPLTLSFACAVTNKTAFFYSFMLAVRHIISALCRIFSLL